MQTTADLLERNAMQAGSRTAFLCEGEERSYRDFLDRVRRLSSAIELAGLARQDRVGVFGANSIAHFEAAAAAEYGAFIGALYNFRLAAPELSELIAQSEPVVLFFDAALAEVVRQAAQGHTTIRRFIHIGEGDLDWSTPFDQFMNEGDPGGPSQRPGPEDVGTLFYTGGTTGKPRGVPWSHQTLLRAAHCMQPAIEDIVLLQISPAFHTGGRCPVLTTMWAGGTVVLERNFDARRWLDLVSTQGVNWTFMVPAMMQAVLDHPALESSDLTSLEYVMAASTAIPPSLLTRAIAAMGRVFYVAYGSTEGGYVARSRRSETCADGPPIMTERLGSVGQVCPWAGVVLLDNDDRPVGLGCVGEICVRNYAFREYWNDPEATREALVMGHYVRTGDMGRFDAEGYLWLVDRKKDMIISGGENVFCREVENAIDQHPDVRSVAVIGMADDKWGESVLALVVCHPGSDLDGEALIAFSRERLARYKSPKRVIFLDEFPVTGAGKIDKVELRRLYRTGEMA